MFPEVDVHSDSAGASVESTDRVEPRVGELDLAPADTEACCSPGSSEAIGFRTVLLGPFLAEEPVVALHNIS